MIKNILMIGNKILHTKSKEVTDFSTTEKIIKDLKDTLVYNLNGAGLSAIQIGISKQIFIMRDDSGQILEFINPKIVDRTGNNIKVTEGCLSMPNIKKTIVRNTEIEIEFADTTGEVHSGQLEGMESIIAQHEMDHLKGLLITDRAKIQRKKKKR